MPNKLKRTETDSEILGGKPVIKGTRIAVDLVVELLASGMTEQDVLKEYPTLHREDIRAALEYASRVLRQEEIIPLRRRTQVDVMVDILRVAAHPSSTTQILYSANLSYEQARKYLQLLVKSGMVSRVSEEGSTEKFVTTKNGQGFLSQMSRFREEISMPELSRVRD